MLTLSSEGVEGCRLCSQAGTSLVTRQLGWSRLSLANEEGKQSGILFNSATALRTSGVEGAQATYSLTDSHGVRSIPLITMH